jgi:DNA polymerase V
MLHQHKTTLTVYNAAFEVQLPRPFIGAVHAGFPSPAADFLDATIDLNKYVVNKPSATYFARVEGLSMTGAGIGDKDLLIIDKSLKPRNNCIAICVVDGEFTLKRLKVNDKEVWLLPENPRYPPIKITEDNNLQIWGIVTYSLQKHY